MLFECRCRRSREHNASMGLPRQKISEITRMESEEEPKSDHAVK